MKIRSGGTGQDLPKSPGPLMPVMDTWRLRLCVAGQDPDLLFQNSDTLL